MAQPLAAGALAASAITVLALINPSEPGHYPLCPFRAMTGFDCPGCGSLRALHDLATGHPLSALDHNALTVLAVPFMVLAWAGWLRRSALGLRRPAPQPRWVVLTLLALVVVWWIVRNLPGVPFLGSGIG